MQKTEEEVVVDQLDRLTWHYLEDLSQGEMTKRLVEVKKILKETNISITDVLKFSQRRDSEKHLSTVNMLSKLAVQQIARN